jgi:HEAT repeat protein
MRPHSAFGWLVLVCVAAWTGRAAAEPDTSLADELTLKSAGLRSDGPALLEFLRQRTRDDAEPETLKSLIRDLGGPTAAVREKAVAKLVTRGAATIPLLRLASKDLDDAERAGNARRCLQALEGGGSAAVTTAAIRLVGLRKPAGAAEVLLAFLPRAEDEAVIEQIRNALVAMAYMDQNPDPALVRALDDSLSVRRVIAAEALGQAGTGEPFPGLRKLLRDPQPLVRLRVALMLADRKEAEAITTLIALLTDLPPNQAKPAEDYLFALAGELAPNLLLGNDAASAKKCRDAWDAWWRRSEGPNLLDEFRKRGVTGADWEKAQQAIKNLADDSFEIREKATTDLMAMHSAIVPLLRQAANGGDPEVAQRVQKVLEKFEKDKYTPVSGITARLVAYRKPPGAAAALLNFLPFAEDAPTAADVQAALIDVAVRDGKPEKAVVQALEDKSPLRRAAAAEALGWAGGPNQRQAVRKLLKDADAAVRMRAALTLAGFQEREAIPVLIALLSEMPRDQAYEVETYLRSLKGARLPIVPLGVDEAGRRKCRETWDAWWQAQSARVELAALARPVGIQRYLGYVLLVMPDSGQIMELGADHKPRWQQQGLQNPNDAQALPGDRFIVAESNASRVSERNQKNEIIWEKQVNWPMGCQRLPNGNTFITTRNQLLEVDRNGKEVHSINRNFNDVLVAQKLRDGHIVCLTQNGMCLKLDATGKEVKSFRVGQTFNSTLDVLSNGNILIPQMWMNKVIEYDSDGKQVWETTIQQPSAAFRLSNGNTLVSTQWPTKVVEMDRTGKVLWEYQTPNRVGRIRLR